MADFECLPCPNLPLVFGQKVYTEKSSNYKSNCVFEEQEIRSMTSVPIFFKSIVKAVCHFGRVLQESREGRVTSWQNFKAGKTTKKAKAKVGKPLGFRPPKLKPEQR